MTDEQVIEWAQRVGIFLLGNQPIETTFKAQLLAIARLAYEQRAENAELREALRPVQHYVAMRDAMPIRGLSDDIHSIHAGTQWEASLSLTDLRAVVAILAKHKEQEHD